MNNIIKVTWIGHSCFKVQFNEYSVVFDPTNDRYVPGIKPIREEADIVICSHQHGDHNARELIRESGERDAFEITEIETFHDDKEGALRGENTISIVACDGLKVAHFGDLGCEPTEDQLAFLNDLDLALIPVGGYYTIDGKEAAGIIKKIKPRNVIPMHYRDDEKGFGFDVISTVNDFLEEMENIEILDKSSVDLHIDSSNLDTRVIVLVPQNL